MNRLCNALAVAAALTLPVASLADTPRATSPARQSLNALMIDMPVHRDGRHGSRIVGDWTPRAVHAPRFGLIGLPQGPGTWFTVRRDGRLSFSVGCNRYWANVRFGYGQIDVGRIAGTRMACHDRQSAAERRVIRALRRAVRVETWHGQVRLIDPHGVTWLILDAPTPRVHPYRP
jgi:hypothetical protein